MIYDFFDFGQHSKYDTEYTNKLLSPFGKYFDECKLQNDETATLKSFRPFDDVQNKVIDESIADGEAYKVVTDRLIRLIRWIGSGA